MDPVTAEEWRKPGLFAPGYRACDVLLLALLFGGPSMVYYSVIKATVPFGWFHGTVLSVSMISVRGFFRIRFAFALLALPFFIWAAWSFARALFFPPEWSDLISPIYAGKWAVSIVIEYMIGAYFWKKFSDIDFLDWIGSALWRTNS